MSLSTSFRPERNGRNAGQETRHDNLSRILLDENQAKADSAGRSYLLKSMDAAANGRHFPPLRFRVRIWSLPHRFAHYEVRLNLEMGSMHYR